MLDTVIGGVAFSGKDMPYLLHKPNGSRVAHAGIFLPQSLFSAIMSSYAKSPRLHEKRAAQKSLSVKNGRRAFKEELS